MSEIAVIGAGLAGLVCARELQTAGHRVTVFEKSRGIGGRIATRRSRTGLQFDHGAQFISTTSPGFRAFVDTLVAAGHMVQWSPTQNVVSERSHSWFVGAPAMNSFLGPLADAMDIRFETRVEHVTAASQKWHLHLDSGDDMAPFDAVACAIPSPQASEVLAAVEDIGTQLKDVEVDPCWALMLQFAKPIKGVADTWRHPTPELAWIARSSCKPGRITEDSWVVHASPAWSIAHLEETKEQIAPVMLDLFSQAIGIAVEEPDYIAAHRWRFAQTSKPLGKRYLASEDGSLVVGGDWALGAKVEYAYESGYSMAQALLECLGRRP